VPLVCECVSYYKVPLPWSAMFQQIQKWEDKDGLLPQQVFQYMIDYANHSLKVSHMVNNYRNFGHFKAQWDPLHLDSQFGFYKGLLPQDRKQALTWEYYQHSSKATDALSIGHFPVVSRVGEMADFNSCIESVSQVLVPTPRKHLLW